MLRETSSFRATAADVEFEHGEVPEVRRLEIEVAGKPAVANFVLVEGTIEFVGLGKVGAGSVAVKEA